MNQDLNILVQSSEYYAPFAGVMLTSLFKNNQEIDQISVYLMTADMSEKNRGRFRSLAEQYRREIKFIDTKEIDRFLENNQAPRYHGAYTPYYKIFALSVIKDKIDRLIYLDSDMVINGSLSALMTCDLGGHVLGMCIDPIHAKYKNLIGCKSEDYYNTGMIVFDVRKWKECRGAERVIKHMTTVRAAYPLVDQDLLNIVFSGEIAVILQKYNCYSVVFVYKDYRFLKKAYGITNYYSEEEVMSAKQDPVILHCIETFGLRPWHEGEHPYKEIWKKYWKSSLWNDFSFIAYNAPIMNKSQHFLFKTMPKKLFAVINRTCVYFVLLRKARKCGLSRKCRC